MSASDDGGYVGVGMQGFQKEITAAVTERITELQDEAKRRDEIIELQHREIARWKAEARKQAEAVLAGDRDFREQFARDKHNRKLATRVVIGWVAAAVLVIIVAVVR